MQIPSIKLRNITESPETIEIGNNEFIGTYTDNIPLAFEKLFTSKWEKGGIPLQWGGKTSERIVGHLL